MSDSRRKYHLKLIGVHGVEKEMDFFAIDDKDAFNSAHDGLDIKDGKWVEVKEIKPGDENEKADE